MVLVKGGDNDVLYCCDKSDERRYRRRRFLVPVCEKNYPLPLNVPNVPYIP